MKKTYKYIIAVVIFLGMLTGIVYSLNYMPKEDKEKENKTEQVDPIEKTLVDIEVNSNKEELYKELNEIFNSYGEIADLKDLEAIANGSKRIEEILSQEQIDSLYFYDTYSRPEDKSLAVQAIMSIAYIIKNDNYKINETEKKIAINNIALDSKRGFASVPLILYTDKMPTSYIDMIYDDGKWKPVMKNLVNEIKLLDYITNEYLLKEGEK